MSPDGRTVAVTVLPSSDASAGHIALYRYDTGEIVRNMTTGSTDALPAWSPDGSMIAFQRGTSLYTTETNASPGHERLLTSSGETPTWGGAPDPAATGLNVRRTQHGPTAKARLIVRLAGSRVETWLISRDGTLHGTILGQAVIRHAAAGRCSVAVPMNRRGKRVLKRAGNVTLTVRVSVTPPIGTSTTLTGRVALTR